MIFKPIWLGSLIPEPYLGPWLGPRGRYSRCNWDLFENFHFWALNFIAKYTFLRPQLGAPIITVQKHKISAFAGKKNWYRIYLRSKVRGLQFATTLNQHFHVKLRVQKIECRVDFGMIFVPALYPTTQKAVSVQLSSFLIPVKAEVMPDRIAYQKFNWGPNWGPYSSFTSRKSLKKFFQNLP